MLASPRVTPAPVSFAYDSQCLRSLGQRLEQGDLYTSILEIQLRLAASSGSTKAGLQIPQPAYLSLQPCMLQGSSESRSVECATFECVCAVANIVSSVVNPLTISR